MPDPVPCRLTLSGFHRTVLIHARDKAMRCQRAATYNCQIPIPICDPDTVLITYSSSEKKAGNSSFRKLVGGPLESISDYSTTRSLHARDDSQFPILSVACCAGMATWRNEWFAESTPWSVGSFGRQWLQLLSKGNGRIQAVPVALPIRYEWIVEAL